MNLKEKNNNQQIVEAVVDFGRTAETIVKKLRTMEPASIEFVTLIDKSENNQVKLASS